ncbi:MAG: UDP-N-acetylglucosamine 2-epimerase [Fimbriimonadaceae bacterium]|nr:UDP-N-acetylglucosamine 2-epimerase [Fimbriimonadaceae bacterium]
MAKPRIVCVAGTRPDAIKSAPVVLELKKWADVDTVLLTTGQHREMLDQALAAFGLVADHDLSIMQHGQTLCDVTSRSLSGIDAFLAETGADILMAQGDTTTTFAAGLAAFYRKIPFCHIEAGLRTDSIWNPFPEEFNRRAVSLFATHHYAPTRESAEALAREGHAEGVFVTGNTGIDAVLAMANNRQQDWFPEHAGRIVLLTTHRRENWGEPQLRIARAARRIVQTFHDVLLVVPMHRNPDVRERLRSVLQGCERAALIEPPDYPDFVTLMRRSDLILTDSGGVQEEAPAFGKPVLVLRETTERPEGVTAGVAELVGSDEERIFEKASQLLRDESDYRRMSQAVSPYGDGRASARIRYLALRMLGIDSREEQMWTS